MANRLAGTCHVTVAGATLSIVGAGTYQPDQETRETQMGQDGYHGYKAMPAPGRMSWTGRDGSDVSIRQIAGLDDATVVFELANGKTVVGQNMVRVGEPVAVNTEEATYEIPSVTEN